MKLPHRRKFRIWPRALPRCQACRAWRGRKPIRRGLINPEGDQSAFGDETAEVMGSNGAMDVPQDIKPKQTVRQDFDNV
jgi:hypothetical protein